ncbi:hypothetical protein PRUPE_6G342500 [Prunus persica]|uniref:Uncharacterized protein n=1 Tax=Prunus persica TaxID=3760 RepID=A0A251NZR6_PRUPE|nr:hypothetical protein PRUPE_6G342500 [Prunus persica]
MYEFARLDCMTTVTIFSRSRRLMEHSCTSGRRTRKIKKKGIGESVFGVVQTHTSQGAGMHGTIWHFFTFFTLISVID